MSLSPRARQGVLVCILMLACGTRLYGIGWGGPFVYHPDERTEVGRAMRMVATGDLHPHFFLKPSLFLYLQAAVFSVVESVADRPVSEGMYSRGPASPDPPPSAFLYHWWGRCTAAVMGGVSVLLVYATGRRLFTSGVGLWAAFFLSITPRHALESHYAAVDVPVTAMCLLAFVFTVRAFQAGKRQDWALAGLFAGFAASTKYPGGLIVLAPVVALLLSPRRSRLFDRTFWLGSAGIGAASLIGFVLGTPYAVLDFSQFFWQGIAYEWTHYSTGHPGQEGPANHWWYARNLFSHILGPSLSIAALAGLVRSLLRPARQGFVLLSFPLLYFAFVSSFTVRFERQMMPILPFAAVWAGLACDAAGRWLAERCHAWQKPALERCIIPGLVLLVGVWPLLVVLQDSYRFSLPDTRSVASEWIEKNLRRGTLAREEFTPQMPNLPASQVRYEPWGIAKRGLEAWRAEGVTYLIVSSWLYGLYFTDPEKYHTQVEGYQRIFQLPLVVEFVPGKTHRGPRIGIYALGESGAG